LQAGTNRPNILDFERGFWPMSLPLFQGSRDLAALVLMLSMMDSFQLKKAARDSPPKLRLVSA
jgi:hypothetical protein